MMKLAQLTGLTLVFFSMSLVLAGGFRIPKKEEMPKYLKLLQTSASASERTKAADMIGKRGGINANDVEDAVEPLKKILQKDTDAKVRAAAARALGNIHPDAGETVPLLIDRLQNDMSMDVKMASVVALGQFGAEAKEAVNPLRELGTKFDMRKTKEGQTIMATLKLINGGKKKKN